MRTTNNTKHQHNYKPHLEVQTSSLSQLCQFISVPMFCLYLHLQTFVLDFPTIVHFMYSFRNKIYPKKSCELNCTYQRLSYKFFNLAMTKTSNFFNLSIRALGFSSNIPFIMKLVVFNRQFCTFFNLNILSFKCLVLFCRILHAKD